MSAAACSLDPDDRSGDPDPRVDGGDARVLAERAGCTDGEATDAVLGGEHAMAGWECVIEDRWALELVTGLSAERVENAVERLSERWASDARCPDGTLSNPGTVSGPDWVAFVSDHEGAAEVADRLDGELRPNEIAGPPIDQRNLPCPVAP